ncbi:hypothetical protein Hanom_Chr10g00910551 [Helianthus anomalus]
MFRIFIKIGQSFLGFWTIATIEVVVILSQFNNVFNKQYISKIFVKCKSVNNH